MYKINLKLDKGIFITSIFFLIFSICLFIVILGLTFGGRIKKMTLDSSIKADYVQPNCKSGAAGEVSSDTVSITSSGKLCSPIYYYTVNGNEFTCKTNHAGGWDLKENQNMVYYDSNNPSRCVNDYAVDSNIKAYIFCLGWTFFTGFILNGMIKTKKYIKKMKKLAINGILFQNVLLENAELGNSGIMGKKVDLMLPSGENVHIGNIRGNYDKTVDILIDPDDSSNYYIDSKITKI